MDKNLVYLIIFFIYCFNHIAKIEKKFELYNFLMIFFFRIYENTYKYNIIVYITKGCKIKQ